MKVWIQTDRYNDKENTKILVDVGVVRIYPQTRQVIEGRSLVGRTFFSITFWPKDDPRSHSGFALNLMFKKAKEAQEFWDQYEHLSTTQSTPVDLTEYTLLGATQCPTN